MLVGPHYRPFFQMLQLLLFFSLDNNSLCTMYTLLCEAWSTLSVSSDLLYTHFCNRQLWIELASSMYQLWAELVNLVYLKICQVIFNHHTMWLIVVFLGYMFNPVRLGIDTCASGAGKRKDFIPKATVGNVLC